MIKEYDDALLETHFSVNKDSGFTVAAGMWKWGDWQDDPEIGELKFVLKRWTNGTDFGFEELKQRKCTEQDFIIDEHDKKDGTK